MSTNAVAKSQAMDQPTKLARQLEASYTTALPRHVTKEQFARALLTSFRRTPKLMGCDTQTIANSVVTAAQLGLMIGVNGSCWLIPYGKECNLIIGYQGLVDLCYRSSRVDSVFADVVCEHDSFDFVQGLNQRLEHTPCMNGERGAPFAVYAMASIKGSNRPVFVVLTKSEVMKIKNSSPGARSKESPWNGPFESEMWKKTAIRRLVKLLPKSVDLMEALEFESRQEEKWTDSHVIDDPFAQGRNSLPAKSSAKADSSPAVGSKNSSDTNHTEDAFKDAYATLNGMYNEHARAIDDLLFKNGASRELPDMQGTTDPKEIAAVIKTAEQMKV